MFVGQPDASTLTNTCICIRLCYNSYFSHPTMPAGPYMLINYAQAEDAAQLLAPTAQRQVVVPPRLYMKH